MAWRFDGAEIRSLDFEAWNSVKVYATKVEWRTDAAEIRRLDSEASSWIHLEMKYAGQNSVLAFES